MNQPLPTVYVEPMDDLPAIRMTWQASPTGRDVSEAFRAITGLLTSSPGGLYVVVDLRQDPKFPLAATINGALFGPYRNPKLREWLIIGSNPVARLIERTLSSVTGRSNVRWFKDDDEVAAYIHRETVISDI